LTYRAQDSGPAEIFVKIMLVFDVLDTNHVAYDLVYPFNDEVRLRIPCGNLLDSSSAFIFESRLHFCFELATSIHSNLGWPRVASEPMELEEVGYEVGLLGKDLDNLKPSCGWVYHC
jgi:hypothetical protein